MEALSIVLLILVLVAVAGGLYAWSRWRRADALAAHEFQERRRLEAEAGALHKERDRLAADTSDREELGRRIEQLEAEAADRENALGEEREARSRVERWRQVEHDWNEELRVRLAQLTAARHPLGDTSDVRALVLRTGIQLLRAEKGLLLSREDEDSDGDLDLVCTEGFEHDPEDSAIAQHFARQVLARDETVRAGNPGELDLVGQTGADDEIDSLVAIPIYIRDRFTGVLVCANTPGGFTEYDDDILLALGNQAGAVLLNARLRGEVRASYLSMVRVLADAVEAKDRTLRGHANEVSEYVAHVAERIGLEPSSREKLLFASLLHDIGKLGISERILLKPGPLTQEERAIVQLHPRIGARLIEQVPALREIAPAVLYHHERWDGEGYPGRLGGNDIPVEARVLAVADAFSAMTSDRPYRAKMALDEACDELRRCAGSQFDASIVRLFVEEIRRQPPEKKAPDALTAALSDSELVTRRDGDEPLLGFGAFSAVDNLTLLYSHRYLHELAEAEARRADLQGRPFAVVLLELSDLAELNRERGYAVGDEAIRSAADIVGRVASRCGGTAARESGRRICLLVPGADEAIAERLAEEILAGLEGQNVRVRVAAWQQGDSGEAVLARAVGRLAKIPALADSAS
jgi:diguanylate cyclase (GGDEF)-like protein